ncbi:alpha/beta hydrolase [Streptomyces sp. tea 10]|nr:alpha/beta hydrolase [Streptomyces sp. tea 10]
MRTPVLEAGEVDRSALVLVHGAGQGGRMWRRQLGALSDGFHVVAPDLPGFGGSPGPFSLTAAVESVTEIARQLRSVHLCGHSLGAIVAARVAAENPDLVARLILSGGLRSHRARRHSGGFGSNGIAPAGWSARSPTCPIAMGGSTCWMLCRRVTSPAYFRGSPFPRLCCAESGIAPVCRMPDGPRWQSRKPSCPWFRTRGISCP